MAWPPVARKKQLVDPAGQLFFLDVSFLCLKLWSLKLVPEMAFATAFSVIPELFELRIFTVRVSPKGNTATTSGRLVKASRAL